MKITTWVVTTVCDGFEAFLFVLIVALMLGLAFGVHC